MVVNAVILSEVFYVGIFYFDLYKVLMDTGTLHFSYISRDLVDKHRDAWRGKVMYVDGEDCLGGFGATVAKQFSWQIKT